MRNNISPSETQMQKESASQYLQQKNAYDRRFAFNSLDRNKQDIQDREEQLRNQYFSQINNQQQNIPNDFSTAQTQQYYPAMSQGQLKQSDNQAIRARTEFQRNEENEPYEIQGSNHSINQSKIQQINSLQGLSDENLDLINLQSNPPRSESHQFGSLQNLNKIQLGKSDSQLRFQNVEGVERMKSTAEFGNQWYAPKEEEQNAYQIEEDIPQEHIENQVKFFQINEEQPENNYLDQVLQYYSQYLDQIYTLQKYAKSLKKIKLSIMFKQFGKDHQVVLQKSNVPSSRVAVHNRGEGRIFMNEILESYMNSLIQFNPKKDECQRNQRVQNILKDKDVSYLEEYRFLKHKGVYKGSWKKGLRHGFGIFYLDNQVYEGFWEDNYASGYGRTIFINGDIYEGEYFKDIAQGIGIYVTKKGIRYCGQWAHNKQNGYGREEWLDRSVFIGTFSMGTKQGKGRFAFGDGSIYEGQFINNMFHGKGTYIWPNGKKYDGNWIKNKMEGKGTFTWPDGRKFVGIYKQGQRQGVGVHFWPHGEYFEGIWKDGLQHGEGIYTDAEKESQRGVWKLGNFVKWI